MPKYAHTTDLVTAEQFTVKPGEGDQPSQPDHVPEGMSLWPDHTGLVPRDMSWGYIYSSAAADRLLQQQHVHAGDWVITRPDGIMEVLSVAEMRASYVEVADAQPEVS